MPWNEAPFAALWVPAVTSAVLAALGIIVVQFLGFRALRFVRNLPNILKARRQQFVTFIQVLQWGLSLGIGVVFVLILLSALGLDITPLIASAGVAGLAVSMAAQGLLRDLIGGMLILIENQYVVGDVIKVGDVSGTVERITLRATYIRDLNGSLHLIPNGEVRVVSNMTRDWARAIVDLRVAYEENIDQVLDLLRDVSATLMEDAELASHILEDPQVTGPLKLEENAFTVRVAVKTKVGKQLTIAHALQKRIHAAFRRERIALPHLYLDVWPPDNTSR